MALTKVPLCEADTVGTQETVCVQAEYTTLANAFYGKDGSGQPKPVDSIATDGKSLKFTVLAGKVPLEMNFVSSIDDDDDVVLYQGDPVKGELAEFTSEGTASYWLMIAGI